MALEISDTLTSEPRPHRMSVMWCAWAAGPPEGTNTSGSCSPQLSIFSPQQWGCLSGALIIKLEILSFS